MSALTVLALLFLSFAHQPVTLGQGLVADSFYQFADFSICGDGPSDRKTVHGPCHACRVAVADLPPPPCEAEPAYADFVALVFDPDNNPALSSLPGDAYNPRAPPVSV